MKHFRTISKEPRRKRRRKKSRKTCPGRYNTKASTSPPYYRVFI
jgi:hypothetical protein